MPRLQFTIRALLWATFWLAAACAAMILQIARSLRLSELLGCAFVACLVFTGGALVGRTKEGLAVGVLLWLLAVTLLGNRN